MLKTFVGNDKILYVFVAFWQFSSIIIDAFQRPSIPKFPNTAPINKAQMEKKIFCKQQKKEENRRCHNEMNLIRA